MPAVVVFGMPPAAGLTGFITLGFGFGSSVVVTAVGLSWTLPPGRLHYTLDVDRLHYTPAADRLHWTLPPEE